MGHVEIFEQLRREILAGKFDDAPRFPSETALARRFGVSRPTMSRVMLDMKREGLVVTRKGAPAMLTRFARNATGALGIVVPGVCYAEIFSPSGMMRVSGARASEASSGNARMSSRSATNPTSRPGRSPTACCGRSAPKARWSRTWARRRSSRRLRTPCW